MSFIPRAKHPDGWMVALSTYSEAEAHIVAGRLQAESIKVWLFREAAGAAMGITVGPLGEIRVLVLPEEYERAVEILAVDWTEDGDPTVEALDDGTE